MYKKYKDKGLLCPYENNKRIVNIMKITVLLLCAGILSVSAVGYSQDAKVSLQVRNKSVNEVLSAIKEQTSYSFWFDVKDVDVDRMVSLDVKNATVRMVLDHAFKDQDVDFVMYGNHIIIGKKGSFSHVQGQGIPISGMVTDENDDPMPGVNVMVKGTTTGVVTDINGRFSISAPGRESVIIFSFVGYEPKEMLVEDKTIINVQMAESAKELEEVVVIGYGQVRKKDLTGAVSQVKTEQFATQISTNVLDYLNGTVAGFNVNVGTSASGAADKDMEIRGPASLAANNTPLIVLDGVIFNGALNDINPLDIETIDVLKDASSAAVYGSRSAAGVIIISTKKGRSEKTSINFSVQLGITGFTKEMKPFGPDGYLKYRQDYLVRTNPGQPEAYYTNPNRLPSGIDVDTWQNYDVTPAADPIHTWMNRMQLQEVEKQNYMDNKSLDWYDAATRTGFRQNYDVSLSGGTEKLKYYWSLGYTDNKGRMKGDEYKTIRSRINADMRVTDFLNVGVNAQFSNKDMSNVALTLNNVILQSPLGQLYDESGLLKWYPHDDSGVSNPFLANEYRDK